MDKVWIVFNEQREVVGVCTEIEFADDLLDAYSKSTDNMEFYYEEHDVDN